jgi:hypothetical protein
MKLSLLLALMIISTSAFARKYQRLTCKAANGYTANALIDATVAIAGMNESNISKAILTLNDENGKAILKSAINIEAFGIFGDNFVLSSAGVNNDEDSDAIAAHLVSLSIPEKAYGKPGIISVDISFDAIRSNYKDYSVNGARCTSTLE